jgi:peptide/nickel transport system substrate-binding protein
MKRPLIGFTSLLLAATAGLALVASAQAPPVKPQWVIALNEEAESVDPASSVLFASDVYHVHMFDTLVGLEGDELKPTPGLAERWENVNPTTWRFHLRRGVKFHNGQALDANDVKYSVETYLDPKSRRATFVKGIVRAEVRDPFTVDIVTAEPLASALFNVVRMYILPRETREKMGAQAFAEKPVGTGPYRFVEWKRDQQLVLEANPTYWRGAPAPRRLVFRIVKDASTRAAELRSGGVDIIAAPPVPQLDMLDSGDTHVVPVKGGRLIIYPMHVKQPPFDKGKVREAMNLAVNREAIVKSVLGGRGTVLAGPFTPAWLGYDPAVKPFPYDPPRARQLLAEAGYPQGFETTWSISSGVFLKDAEIAEAVAGQLRQVGVRVKLVPTERSKIQKDAVEGTFQGMTSIAWGAQFEPDAMLSWVFARPHLSTPRIMELVQQGRGEVNLEKRRAIYQDLYRQAHDEALWLFVHAQDELWAERRDVNWTPYNVSGSKAKVYYFATGGRQ